MRVVLYDEEDGVYLGSAFGLGFWSKLDPVGQPCAVTLVVSGWKWIPESRRWAHYCRGDRVGHAAEPDATPQKGDGA